MVIQAVTAVMMVLRDADVRPRTASNTASPRKLLRHWHGGPALKKPSFNLNAQDSCIELPNFEMEVMNILDTKTYEFTDEEKVLVIKRWLGKEGLKLTETFTNEEEESEILQNSWFLY